MFFHWAKLIINRNLVRARESRTGKGKNIKIYKKGTLNQTKREPKENVKIKEKVGSKRRTGITRRKREPKETRVKPR